MSQFRSIIKQILPVSMLIRLRALDYRLHSKSEWRLLSKLCDPSKCSIDIGANLGVLTYYLAKYSSGVRAYEPNPDLARRLCKAFGNRVTVVEAALSDEAGTTVLKIPRYHGVEMHGLASIAQDFKNADSVKEYSVPVRRLDDEGLTNVGFVKIDVEQNEERVLRGAMHFLKSQKPNILLEVSPKLYEQPLKEFLKDLLVLGYHSYFLFDGALLQLDEYRIEVHNHSDNYGVSGKYMTNVILSTKPLTFN